MARIDQHDTENDLARMVTVDRDAILALVAELESRFVDFAKDVGRTQNALNAAHALLEQHQRNASPVPLTALPKPEEAALLPPPQSIQPVITSYVDTPQPDYQPHIIARMADKLMPFFPQLWSIRPYLDDITWRKLLIYLAVIVVIANTSLAQQLTFTFPVFAPIVKFVRLDTYTTPHPDQKGKGTCNAQDQFAIPTPNPAQTDNGGAPSAVGGPQGPAQPH